MMAGIRGGSTAAACQVMRLLPRGGVIEAETARTHCPGT
jgi:hypothetical protein